MARVRKDFDSLMKELEEIKNKIETKKEQEADSIYNFLLKEFNTDSLDYESFKYWFNNLNKEDKKTLKEVQEEMKNINKNDVKEDSKEDSKEESKEESKEDLKDDYTFEDVEENNYNSDSKYTNI